MRSTRKPLLAVALAGAVVALPALAQQPTPYPAPCDAAKVSKADVERAHNVYLSGKQYLDESNYDKAISYFTDAYSIDCSVHGILPAIATAYERKGDKAEAIRALEEYLRRAPNAPDREKIERRVRNLNEQLAHEQPAPSAQAPLAPTASAAPPAPAAPEASATISPLAAAPAPVDVGAKPSRSPLPWVLTGAGGVVAIAGGALLAVGNSDISTASSSCPTRKGCPTSIADKGNTGRTLEAIGWAGVGVGGAALATGVILLILQASSTQAAPASSASAYLTPVIAPGYAGIAAGSQL
jgi:tetratricopeptide (TPR) repeat protein